ncbi:MAG: Gfo/Idh/MocA family oxidoreductase [Lentisphaeria bacterium]|nr:Gfo/Idh/MocA family oxidoreductase [Lentisphaeria bacterium]
MGIKIGLVGLGTFGTIFAPLFAGHPLVDSVVLCDAEADRIAQNAAIPVVARKLVNSQCTQNFDEICKSDCDALVIMTQPWLHAPQCIQAMEHGKMVYSAVPVISLPDDQEILDWCGKIIETVQRTGVEYMLGETTIYRPHTMFCKRMAKEGKFGDFVYAEAEYAHDVDAFGCSLREVAAKRAQGKIGEQRAGIMKPYYERGCKSHPMNYPTHSVSGVVDVVQSRPVKVFACGFRNTNEDPYFANYDFTNITGLFYLENGMSFRVSEMREISPNIGLDGEDFRIFGTRGSYSNNQWADNGRTVPTPDRKENKMTKLTDEEMRDPLPEEVVAAFTEAVKEEKGHGDFMFGGHGGSHPYLVHEFVSAVAERRRPAISAWDAAMYMAMGVAAHQSAVRDGELVQVVDFGKRW